MATDFPGGDGSPIVDFTAHFLADIDGAPIHECIERTAGAPIHGDPDEARAVQRAAGVDRMVLSQPPHIGSADAAAVRRGNDALLDIIEDDETFHGLAALPVGAGGETAAREFERCLDAGYNGGAIETRSEGIEVIDEAIEPVLEVADETGAPLLVHPKLFESVAPGVYERDEPLALNATFGREVALCESVWKVIHRGVLDRYPDLTLVYHHYGGNIAGMLGRIEGRLRRDFWPGIEETKPYPEFRRQFEERVYVDTGGYTDHRGILGSTLSELPASNVLFGSDFPYEARTPEQIEAILAAIEDVTSGTDARRIRGQNALDLLVNLD